MFTTCAFCSGRLDGDGGPSGLGVGRRLAFDEWKARLWVVCPRCGQWNLTPFEERWDAVETAERLFRDTPRRVQGEQIGLARVPEGLELVPDHAVHA